MRPKRLQLTLQYSPKNLVCASFCSLIKAALTNWLLDLLIMVELFKFARKIAEEPPLKAILSGEFERCITAYELTSMVSRIRIKSRRKGSVGRGYQKYLIRENNLLLFIDGVS